MEFEPFHSSEDEDANIIKKRDSEKRKKKIKSERKEKTSFDLSPLGVRPKQIVHGVVGPADYLEQGTPPNTEKSNLPAKPQVPSFTIQSPNVKTLPRKEDHDWPPTNHTQQHNFPLPAHHAQPVPHSPMFHTHHATPVTLSSKIERPHSSASILSQEIQNSNSPMPFKQSTITPSKMTLLERAKATAQPQNTETPFIDHQQAGNQFQQQVNTANSVNHQRNQSYSRAMSVPMLSTEHHNSTNMKFQYDIKEGSHIVPPSPIREAVSPINEVHSPFQPPAIQEPIPIPDAHYKTPAKPIPTPPKIPPQDDWANFSLASSSQSSSPNVNEFTNYQEENIAHSFSESNLGSTSSLDSDAEDVWRITNEQREYYINQYKQIQPNTNEAVKGAQARDFFLRSNLPNEILSRIWRLSDLDNDHALNVNEFCIAMHLVVAVRHGIELPQELPYSMIPQNKVEESISADALDNQHAVKSDTNVNINESNSWAATFHHTPENDRKEQQIIQPPVQTLAVDSSSLPQQQKPPQQQSNTSVITSTVQPTETNEVQQINKTQLSLSSELINSQQQLQPPPPQQPQQHQELRQVLSASGRHSSLTGVVDPAIARPRAQASKNVNLMDSSPYQLLPPPSSKQKQKVKKSLTLDNILVSKSHSERGFSGEALLPIEQLGGEDSQEFQYRNDSNDRLEIKKSNTLGLSKEKSRSIDSLRSDISESSEFYWRRASKPEVRPRSFTGESVSDVSIHEKEFEIPPIPPPRAHGHVRSNSLDLNKLLSSSKSSHSVPDLASSGKVSSSKDFRIPQVKPQKPPRINAPKQKSEKRHPGILANQRRAFSDIALQNNKEDGSNLPLTESADSSSKDKLVRFSKSPIEVQMRKNEIQERIDTLKQRNRTLNILSQELHKEYKKVCEERIKLSMQLNVTEDSIIV